MPIEIIPKNWFSGGRNLTEDPDSKRELADLIIELQETINAIEADPAYESMLDILLTPPGAPTSGDRYLINGVGAGAWAGHDYKVAEWDGGAWTFTTYDENDLLLCSGTLNPANEGFWRRTATSWSYMGADTLDPCLDILLTDATLTPADGDRYLINGVGAGGFLGHDYEVAQWNAALPGWAFTSHVKGVQVAVSGDIVASNFGTYLKGTVKWELIPAVASALELKPNSRAVKGRFNRVRNQAGDYLYTGYRTNMGTFLILGNTNAGAGVYTFRIPRVGTSLADTTYANYGWECDVYVPPNCHGTVVLQSRNGADVIATLRPGEMWKLKARRVTSAGADAWQATKRIHGAGLDSGDAIWVDGSRTDQYTPTGTPAYPFKTIQAGLDACSRLGLVRIKKGTYTENVTTVADKFVDAELGTVLRSTVGNTLTLTDDATPPPDSIPPFWRGLLVEAEDAAGWAIHIVSGGTWQPFLVWFDQGIQVKNHANGLWCEGGGVYLTDAGGIAGSPAIVIRVGSPTSPIGGMVITGRNNLNCAGGGIVFDIHENGFVLGDSGSFASDGPGAVLAQMTGLGTPGTGLAFVMREGKSEGPWRSMVRSTGQNCSAQFTNVYSGSWGTCDEEAIHMPDGGRLTMTDCSVSSDTRQALIFGNNVGPSNGNLELLRCEFATNTGQRAIEIRGNVGGPGLRDTVGINRNPAGQGAILMNHSGFLALEGGRYEGNGPTCDHQSGHLFLLGGVDLVANGVGIPGGVPLASAAFANLYRGHCNFRGLTQPIIASVETLLPSSFGIIGFGGSAATVQMSAGPLGLPAGGTGYVYGSLFVHVPAGGPAQVYFNQGSEAAPNWQLMAYVPGVAGNWGAPQPITMAEAMDRVAAAVAGLLGGPIP